MMNKVLIISDNLSLVTFIQDLISLDKYSCWSFDFKFSSINKDPSAVLPLGMTEVNVKDSNQIDYILETYSLVISAHCKQIFPERLVKNVRCINIHPGFNPFNRGWYPQIFSIINKKPIGVTIHEMDEEIDHGKILYQEQVQINPSDTSLEVYEKVINLEKKLIKKHLHEILEGNVQSSFYASGEGNYNSIEDFRQLCKLDLDKKGTLREHIDLLRALTHGDFANAYFEENGGTYFVKIKIQESK